MSKDLALFDCTAQAELVRKGQVKPSELVEAAIGRAERLDDSLGAIVSRQFERARAEAQSTALPQGPLHGVPYLLKDLGAYLDGDPCYSGMGALKKVDYRQRGDSVFAGRLRAAGMISLGRTNSPELGILPTTEPDAFGPTHNPWKLTHSPGGSSGGAAAAVAAGIVPAAHATDGGGSIRVPAAHCGLVGLKPSRGRNSFAPSLGERWAGCSCEGFVTRSVRDTALLLDITSGPAPGDPYFAPPPSRPFAEEVGADPGQLRIGVMRQAPRGGELHADNLAAVDAAAKLLESLGHHVEPSYPEAMEDPEAMFHFVKIVSSCTARMLERVGAIVGRPLGPDDVEALTWSVAEQGRLRGATEYVAALEDMHLHGRRLAAWWDSGFDLLLTPTAAVPPPLLGSMRPEPGNPFAGYAKAAPFGAFTAQFNLSGQPGISLPLHWNDDGLPIGVHLVAPTTREDVLIRVAAQLEAAEPWAARLPPLHATRS